MANGLPLQILSNYGLANLLTDIKDNGYLAQKPRYLILSLSAGLAVLTPSNLALMSDAFQRGGPVKLIGLTLDLCLFHYFGAPSPQDVGAFVGETETLTSLCLQDKCHPPNGVEPNATISCVTGLLNGIRVGGNLKSLLLELEFNGNTGDFQAFASALGRNSRMESLGFVVSRLAENKNTQENMEPIAVAISRMQGLRKLRVGTTICLSHWEKHLPRICKQLIALEIAVDSVEIVSSSGPQSVGLRILDSFLNILKTNESIKTLRLLVGSRHMPRGWQRWQNICAMLHDNCAMTDLEGQECPLFVGQKPDTDPTVSFYLQLNRAGRMKHLAALAGVDATAKDLLHSYLALDQVGAPPRLQLSLLYQLLKVQPSTWCNSQASYQPNEEESKPVGHVGKNEPVSHVGKNKDGSTVQWEQPKAGKTVKVLGKIEDGPASGHGKGKCTKKAKLALNRSSNRYAVLAGDSDSESD